MSFTSALAIAQLPQDSRRPGGIAVVPLSTDITQVTFQQKPVLISQEGQQRYAVLGIPLSTPIGSIQLDTNKAPIQIEVKSYPYAEQRIKVTNQDYVNPNQSQLTATLKKQKNKMMCIPHLHRAHGKSYLHLYARLQGNLATLLKKTL